MKSLFDRRKYPVVIIRALPLPNGGVRYYLSNGEIKDISKEQYESRVKGLIDLSF